ncbi:hypothetical protein E2562_036919 [Oryza meyeriana var. granulata]|uniref:Uncharacterized protein n=1 Tax=Oryza meyeriana var. granulata TaxID=110450 RepID=A0A6G1CL75_9ORYZ|nr:hypothetical protein E2562_036919 [Oryza meyeriana var. granulata]
MPCYGRCFSPDIPTIEEEVTEKAMGIYHLTPLSCLLVDDGVSGIGVHGSLSPFVLSQTTKHHVSAAMHLSEWFMTEDKEVAIQGCSWHRLGGVLWAVMLI